MPTAVQGPQSLEQSALAGVISGAITDEQTIQINLSSGSSTTLIGSFYGSNIDVADVAAFGGGPGPTEASVFGHEVAEQFAKQVHGLGFDPAHSAGQAAEDRISGFTRGEQGNPSGMGGGVIRVVVPYTKDGNRIQVSILIKDGNVIGVARTKPTPCTSAKPCTR